MKKINVKIKPYVGAVLIKSVSLNMKPVTNIQGAIFFSQEAKKKVKDAIATMLSDPEKRTKVLNNSLLVEEDFDFETVKFPSKEVVDTLKVSEILQYMCNNQGCGIEFAELRAELAFKKTQQL